MKKYRDNGAIGAFLDEYEKAVRELQELISTISDSDLVEIVDHETKDEDCKSIQTILSHVISSGKNYVAEARKSLGEVVVYSEKSFLNTVSEYTFELDELFQHNVKLFRDHPKVILEIKNIEEKFVTRWGQTYDIEQLFEHAIVHILRHRRQIERFILRINS